MGISGRFYLFIPYPVNPSLLHDLACICWILDLCTGHLRLYVLFYVHTLLPNEDTSHPSFCIGNIGNKSDDFHH